MWRLCFSWPLYEPVGLDPYILRIDTSRHMSGPMAIKEIWILRVFRPFWTLFDSLADSSQKIDKKHRKAIVMNKQHSPS